MSTLTTKRAGDMVPGDMFYPSVTAMNAIHVSRIERGPYGVVTIRYGFNGERRLLAAESHEFDYLGRERGSSSND